MWKFIKQPSAAIAALLILTNLIQYSTSQNTCNNGQGRVLYERLPNQQLQGFDDDVIRDTAPPFRVLEKCQDLCLRDRTAQNNLVRACTSFDFQPGSRIASYNGNTEYEESTCYLTREQAVPEGIGNLMLVPNSVHFTEVCLTSSRPERECPSRRYVFERYPRKKLKLPVSDMKEITAANRSDCEDKCLSEFSFVCRSANFDSTLRSCSLSRFTRRTHPELLEDDPNSDYLENTCLNAERRCDGLVVFVKEENKKLGGPFEVEIFNNMTLEECQTMCLRAEKYICRSVEFDDKTKQCILSEEDSISQKDDLSISSSPTHHFYDLVCLDNQRGTEYPDNSVTSHLFGGTSGRRPDTAFQRYRNSRLGGEFHSEITGRSLSECLDECLRQTSFQCRSAVYSDRFRTCRLSRFNQRDKMRIVYDEDYDYYENLMLGTETDPMGSTRPDMNWHTTQGDRDNNNLYPDDRYPSRYPSSMPGRYPYERPGMYPGDYDDKTSPLPDRYPEQRPPGYDRYPDPYGSTRPSGGDRERDRYPMSGVDRYPPMPGSVDPYYPMSPDRYPMPGGDRYPMMPGGDRYPMMPGERYPMTHGSDRYPMPPGGDRYPMPPGGDRYPMPASGGRYPMPNGGERYPMPAGGADRYYPRPGIGDPLDSKYPPPTSNRYPEDDRYGGKDPYANKDRYNPDERGPPVGMYPDTRNPPNRGQPIDRPPYGQPFDRPTYSPRPYPDGPDSKYPMMGPYRPGYSENRFPVGNDKFPTNIYKYGNSLPPYSPGVMSYMPYPMDMGDRGYGQRAPRPPYAVMLGFGGQQGGFGGQQGGYGGQQGGGGGGGVGNGISDTFGMPYGPPGMGRPPIQSGTRCDEIDSYKQMGLRQKMKKQYVRRSVFAPSLTHCQRECTNNPGFICRSFNFRDEGERSPAQGSGETFNCELSDRDTRELDLNNSQQFETGNSDFYERSIGGRSNDAECLDVSQVCNEDGMEFTLRTNEQFTGRIYSYGFYDRCFFRGNGGTVNVLRISGPQGYPECGTQRYGDTMTNIIVVQFSESLQTSRDKRFNLTCLFRGPGEAVVTSGYIGAGSGSPIPIEYLPAENSMSSKVRLMILYQGRPTTTIAVGDPLTFRLESQDGYNHINDIFATNVVARDPYSGRSVQLIDRYGCPVDTFVFPELGRSRDGDSLEARFNAFKIPESNFLVFEATVKTCRDGCQPAYCNGLAGRSEASFGRRKRSLNDTDIIEGDSEVAATNVEESVIKTNETTVSNINSNDDDNKDDFPEQVREMIEVFESREEMQQETIAKKMISADTESVCLSVTEYYGLIVSTMLLLILLMSVAVIIGLLYKKYWKIILKNSSFEYHSNHSNTNSFTNHTASRENNLKNYGTPKGKVNNEDFNEAYRSTSTVSLFGSGLQKTFATGNLSRICQIPVINPINKSNGSNYDDSEPIYTGTGTFGRVVIASCTDRTEKSSHYAIKILSICDVIKKKQTEHVKSEKNILLEISHPFVISMKYFSRDQRNLYMVFDFIGGGELFSYLRKVKQFDSDTANFYTREILLALEYLHSLNIIYRDLKPENLLLNIDGHLKITDFGFSKKLKDRTWTLCGTPEYLAPEIVQSRGHNKGVDFWALGILIYEMLIGRPPFYAKDAFAIYELILIGKIAWPKDFDSIAKDLIKKLLVLDRTKRLGCMRNGARDIKCHRWFKDVDWNEVYNKKYVAPIQPKLKSVDDTSNFDEYSEEFSPEEANDKEYGLFEDF